jgi:Guanylylate cyclase
MIWWALCCGDESSVQSSSSTSPAATASAVLASPATESTPLLARSSPHTSEPVTPTPTDGEEEGGAVPSSLSGSREDDENAGKFARATAECTDELAWKEARATLLRGCAPEGTVNVIIEKTNKSTIDDLSLPVPLDLLPTPTSMKHVAQLSTWDCGIACLEMIVDWLGVTTGVDRQAILKSIPTRSVWSADLVRLLDQRLYANAPLLDLDGDDHSSEAYSTTPNAGHSKGRYLFCSQTLSVNDELNSFAYYQNSFEGDRVRVEAAFQWLKDQRGESLIQRPCLRLREIVELLIRPDCVVLILVDNAILSGLRRADENEYKNEVEAPHDVISKGAGPDDVTQPTVTKASSAILYMGHYILLTGIVAPPKTVPRGCDSDDTDDDDDDENDDEPFMFQAHNPSLDFGPVLLSPQLLNDARTAPGTDRDVLFIVKLSSDQDG